MKADERDVQRVFVRECQRAGAVVRKGDRTRGWPDWDVYWPGGVYEMVELKRTGGRLSPMQRVVHARLKRRGHRVIVLRGVKGVERYLTERGHRAD